MYQKFKAECKQEIALQNNVELWEKTHNWMFDERLKKYTYHFEWLGRPIIQYPQDIVAFQELVWQVKPDLIIETGIAHGGSLILSASMLALLEYAEAVQNGIMLDPQNPKRMVLGLDIEIRKHNREAIEAHSMSNRIKMLEGSSIDNGIAQQVYAYAKGFKNIMVCLDSNHTHEHVLAELQLYADLVTKGSYCIVWDTIVEDMPAGSFPERPWDKGNNPKTAVWKYLETNDKFEIDREIHNKLLITVAPDGFLKRVK